MLVMVIHIIDRSRVGFIWSILFIGDRVRYRGDREFLSNMCMPIFLCLSERYSWNGQVNHAMPHFSIILWDYQSSPNKSSTAQKLPSSIRSTTPVSSLYANTNQAKPISSTRNQYW